VKVLVTGEQTQGQFALVETVVTAAQEPPLHAHTHEDEVVYVVRGAVTFYLEGAARPRRDGEAIFLPRGRDHTWRVDSGEATLLVALIPAGVEGVYADLAAPAGHSVERLIALAAHHGITITGPGPATAGR
jgi:quercetin dioxygenase-like cupin family protein